jgi:hypothetical protein
MRCAPRSLEVGKLGDDTGNRGSLCREKRIECVKIVMARLLGDRPRRVEIADLLEPGLLYERDAVCRARPAMGIDHAEHRIWPAVPGRGHGRGDARVHRSSTGKGASTDDARDGGHGEETPPRRIAWREHHGVVDCRRVCGWRDIHAVSLGHWISTP